MIFLFIFLFGFGAGSLCTFAFVGWCMRGATNKQRNFNEQLLELWHERNALHREQIEVIRNK